MYCVYPPSSVHGGVKEKGMVLSSLLCSYKFRSISIHQCSVVTREWPRYRAYCISSHAVLRLFMQYTRRFIKFAQTCCLPQRVFFDGTSPRLTRSAVLSTLKRNYKKSLCDNAQREQVRKSFPREMLLDVSSFNRSPVYNVDVKLFVYITPS